MLLSLLLLTMPASARCTLAALETQVESVPDATRLRRVDRWSWSVGPGYVDCQVLDFASPSAAPIVDLSVAIDRLDGRNPRIDASRVEAVAGAEDPGFGDAAGLRVHVPEVRPGDVIIVEVERSWPRGERFEWRPGARGPLQIATLNVPEGLDTGLSGGALRKERRSWWLEDVAGDSPEPFDDGPAGAASGRWSHGVALLLPARKPLQGLGDARSAATLRAWRQEGGAARRVAAPRDALLRWCVLGEATPCEEIGGVAWRIEDGTEARWGWVEAGAWPGGEIVAPADVDDATVVVSAPRASLRLGSAQDAGAVGEIVPAGVVEDELAALLADYAPVDTEVARILAPGQRLQWSVSRLDGVAVLPDRRAAEQLVARLAVQASVPEPGVGMGFRGRKRDPAVVGEVLDVLADRMQVGQLPGQPDLAPRKLLKVRRSGWGSSWELALVLTRYLRQLKLDAVPLPLRPASLGAPVEGSVDGWPAAVVAVSSPGLDPIYIDPSCPTCAVGQLLPDLDAAWVLSPGLQRLPPLPPSSWERHRDGDDLVVDIDGPLAVDLRRRVMAWPVSQRARRLVDAFAGDGATLAEHVGITEALGHIRLRFTGVSSPPPPAVLLGRSATEGFAPVVGRWTERLPRDPAVAMPPGPVVVEAPGLRWTRAVEDGAWVERLEIEQHELDPAATAAVLDRLSVAWGQQDRTPESR